MKVLTIMSLMSLTYQKSPVKCMHVGHVVQLIDG